MGFRPCRRLSYVFPLRSIYEWLFHRGEADLNYFHPHRGGFWVRYAEMNDVLHRLAHIFYRLKVLFAGGVASLGAQRTKRTPHVLARNLAAPRPAGR